MKLCEYLKTLKPYLGPELSNAEFFDRVFGYCLEDKGADLACEYSRTEKHYFITGESEPCCLAAKVLRYFDEDEFSAYLEEGIAEKELPDLFADFKKVDLRLKNAGWSLCLARTLKDILKRSRDDFRSIRVTGNFKLRAALMEENQDHTCPCPNCSNQLLLHGDTEEDAPYVLQTLYLDNNGPKDASNAIGICTECMMHSERIDLKSLKTKKEMFQRQRKAYAELDDPLFPEHLIAATKKLKESKTDQLQNLSYKALRIAKKILPDNPVLLTRIEGSVTHFFPLLLDCFSEDDGLGEYSYDKLSKSIRALFNSANSTCKTQEEVFETISKKIAAITDASQNVASVITAYFVQTCEVFNEIPE